MFAALLGLVGAVATAWSAGDADPRFGRDSSPTTLPVCGPAQRV